MGTSWISRKGGILEIDGGRGDLEKGGMNPLTNYDGSFTLWWKMQETKTSKLSLLSQIISSVENFCWEKKKAEYWSNEKCHK